MGSKLKERCNALSELLAKPPGERRQDDDEIKVIPETEETSMKPERVEDEVPLSNCPLRVDPSNVVQTWCVVWVLKVTGVIVLKRLHHSTAFAIQQSSPGCQCLAKSKFMHIASITQNSV